MKKTLLAAALFSLCQAASATVGAGLQVGTTGAGFDVAYSVNSLISARMGYSGYSYSKTTNYSGAEFDTKMNLSSIRALADLSLPFGFRATGGLVYQNNKVNLHGKPNGNSYSLNGNTYTASDIEKVDGQIKWSNRVAPYLGIGWGSVSSTGIGFYADVGAMYQGRAKTNLTVTCGAAVSANQCSQIGRDVDAERIKAENDASKYKWYPVVSIGLSIGF